MAAPCAALIPRSLQKATKWVCGIAIGTQQVKIAAICSANTRFGGQPSTDFDTPASCFLGGRSCCGGGARTSAAAGTIRTSSKAA
jgi:ABC-type xylose transport system permease subunit